MSGNSFQLIGKSAEFMRVINVLKMVAVTDTTVLLHGEKGTGKAVLASEAHSISYRRARPFSVLSCTTACQYLAGLVSETDSDMAGGTLYIDEVADLPLEAQGHLADLLERRESGQAVVDVRVIAATSADLHALVETGGFREDLYYRLYVVPLEVPPLRERAEDIPLYLKHFTQELARKHGRRPPSFSISAKNLLKRYHWPGNLRELRNLCERMVVLLPGQNIQPENLPAEIRRNEEQPGRLGFVLPKCGINLAELEVDVIRQALEMTGGNRSRAARLLGISRDTLLYRIQKHAIG